MFKTTDQLAELERKQFRNLFGRVFNKTMTKDAFERKFLCTATGYSYHGLMMHAGVITGALSAIPWRYNFFGQETIFCVSVDTMIDRCHRGGGHLIKMAKALHEGLVRDEIPFIFGFPNELFYPIQKKFLKYCDVGELDYYVLPINIGNIVRKLRPFNPLSQVMCRLVGRFAKARNASRQADYNIAKVVDKTFDTHRYDDSYIRVELQSGATCTYKIYEEEGRIRTLYIIDVIPLTSAVLTEAVKEICRTTADAVDIIIYVGRLNSRPAGLLKVPHSGKPRKIRMTGKILIPQSISSAVLDFENWAVNISDFDVR